MCADCPIHVGVTDGEVTAVENRGGKECTATGTEGAPTLEAVFAEEEQLRSSGTFESFTVSYDPVWGFPASGSFRCPDGYSDCGSGFSVSSFEVLSGQSTSPST